MYKVEKL